MKPSLLLISSIAASLWLGGCVVKNAPAPQPTGEAGNPSSPDATPAETTPPPVASGKVAEGGECQQGSDCDSGTCEGLGCDAPGHCMSKNRMCTDDYREYCGCDGATFGGSGSCPGRRYAARGACQAAPATQPMPAAKVGDGGACAAADDCESGVCEGQGCDAAALGKCTPKLRKCTKDLRAYCGCTGETFKSSGSCPGQRYLAKGACKAAK